MVLGKSRPSFLHFCFGWLASSLCEFRGKVNVMTDRRELYRSANGEAWFLGREPTNGHAFIIHQPNAPTGGRLSHIDLGAFLVTEPKGPEHQALLRLIATLVDVPPFAGRA